MTREHRGIYGRATRIARAILRAAGLAAFGLGLTVGCADAQTARLTLQQVFGVPAASLTCVSDASRSSATWYGNIKFRVKLAGVGATRGKITGLRPSSGTIPDGRLLDGDAGAAATVAYPVAPGASADPKTGIGIRDAVVSRSFGLRVNSSDPFGAWSGNTVFSLVLE